MGSVRTIIHGRMRLPCAVNVHAESVLVVRARRVGMVQVVASGSGRVGSWPKKAQIRDTVKPCNTNHSPHPHSSETGPPQPVQRKENLELIQRSCSSSSCGYLVFASAENNLLSIETSALGASNVESAPKPF